MVPVLAMPTIGIRISTAVAARQESPGFVSIFKPLLAFSEIGAFLAEPARRFAHRAPTAV